MRISTPCLSAALALTLAATSCVAFTVPTGLRHSSFVTPSSVVSSLSTTARPMIGGFFKKGEEVVDADLDDLEPLADDSCRLTPEGFGFSTPASRIIKQAGRKGGYYRASASEFVLDVIAAITNEKEQDVALVYDDNDVLLGIFTEADYIKVCRRQLLGIIHTRFLVCFCGRLSYFNPFSSP